MKQITRYGIVAIILVSLVFLARNKAAGAGIPAASNAVSNGAQLAPNPAPGNPGTVKPPPRRILITESGTYSVGGFCTYTVEFLAPGVTVLVELERPLPRPLPDKVHAVRQGCRVTYYQDGEIIDEFTPDLGTSSICFAATPAKNNKNYFYTVYAPSPEWSPTTDTNVDSGVACSTARPSAVYVGTFEKP